LKKLILGEKVIVETVARDKYGRAVARVYLGNESINKKMQKKYAMAICYGKITSNGCEFATTYWKGRTLAQIPLNVLQNIYDNVKATKLQNGDIILNDNLEALGVKL
jgi:hypothetical protein